MFEEQIEQYLSQIMLPPDYQQRIIDAYNREDKEGPSFEQQRQTLTNRLNRLKELYEWEDVTPEDYRAKRDQLKGELAALPPDANSRKATLERLAKYLKNVGTSWKDAGQEQRNQLAHTIFESLRIEDRTRRGVTPRIEFTPLLVLNHLTHLAQAADASLLEEKCQLCSTYGSDGVNSLIRHTISTLQWARNSFFYFDFGSDPQAA
jgi:hypothetical protein